MRIASVSPFEELRLQDLYTYDILSDESISEFDELLDIVTLIYNCPMAAISFIDENTQWIKANKGLGIKQTEREDAFCRYTILQNNVMQVPDALEDERFKKNRWVLSEPGIRFYAGAPIVSQAGYTLGTVCVIDDKPRLLTNEQTKALTTISNQISKLLELRLKNKLLKQRADEQLQIEKKLLLRTLQVHEQEKLSIGTELHENIAQSLAATKFYLELAEENGGATVELIQKSKTNIAQLIIQVRNLSTSIIPTTLNDYYLKDLLSVLFDQFHKQHGIETRLYFEGNQQIPADVTMTIYRIVEDQLTNIKQHAKATQVIVNINAFSVVNISIRDNGVGADMKKFQKGIGLNNILSRVESYKGHVVFNTSLNKGCELIITIPLQTPIAMLATAI